MTAKQLEQETGCKIMVRGKGSMRDKKKVSACFIIKVDFPTEKLSRKISQFSEMIIKLH